MESPSGSGLMSVAYTSTCTLMTLVAVLLAVRLWRRYNQHLDSSDLPPLVPDGLPFLGNVLGFDKRRPHVTLTQWAAKYGSIFRFRLFNQDIVVLSDVSLIRNALVEQGTAFAGRPPIFRIQFGFHFRKDIIFGTVDPKWQMMKKMAAHTMREFSVGRQNVDAVVEQEMIAMCECYDRHVCARGDFDPSLISLTAVVNAISATVRHKIRN